MTPGEAMGLVGSVLRNHGWTVLESTGEAAKRPGDARIIVRGMLHALDNSTRVWPFSAAVHSEDDWTVDCGVFGRITPAGLDVFHQL